jgi:DNA-binding NtrC family response regulator
LPTHNGREFRAFLHEEFGPLRAIIMPSMPAECATILVVDDEEPVLTAAAEMLRRAGFDVLMATSPPEALTLCREYPEPIHLALLDIVMPSMNGLELRECLRTEYPGIRVVYMSEFNHQEMAWRGVTEIPGDFLRKPFTSSKLVGKVNAGLWKRGAATA